MRVARIVLAVVALAALATAASAQQINGYFGPEKGTVADPRQDGIPTSVFESRQWCTEDECFSQTVCLLAVNFYGPNAGNPYIEVSTAKVNAALRLPGGVFVPPDSPINCELMSPGTCVRVQGHTVSPADAFGQSWIVDSFSLPLSCP
jgi:hypothetical protein